MTDYLGQASPNLLLMLMALALAGAFLFAAIIFITFSRRGKKTPMKHGVPEASAAPAKAALSPEQPSPAGAEQVSMPAPGESLDISVLRSLAAGAPPARAGSPAALPHTGESRAPASPEKTETMMANPEKQRDSEDINLAARLENLPFRPARPAELPELLRLLRDPESGQLVVEVAGQRYTRLADISDRATGQYILKLAAHLLAFTNGVIATEAGIRSVGTPRVDEVPQPPAPSIPPSRPAKWNEARQPVPPPPAPTSQEPAFSVSPSMLKAPEPEPEPRGFLGRTKSGPQPLLPALNLADQINQIVQARLNRSPLAATTRLEIVTDSGGGIQIRVNGKAYSSPDDVPDPQIKELIKASIKEWERQ